MTQPRPLPPGGRLTLQSSSQRLFIVCLGITVGDETPMGPKGGRWELRQKEEERLLGAAVSSAARNRQQAAPKHETWSHWLPVAGAGPSTSLAHAVLPGSKVEHDWVMTNDLPLPDTSTDHKRAARPNQPASCRVDQCQVHQGALPKPARTVPYQQANPLSGR